MLELRVIGNMIAMDNEKSGFLKKVGQSQIFLIKYGELMRFLGCMMYNKSPWGTVFGEMS